jgi:hypothetical protein
LTFDSSTSGGSSLDKKTNQTNTHKDSKFKPGRVILEIGVLFIYTIFRTPHRFGLPLDGAETIESATFHKAVRQGFDLHSFTIPLLVVGTVGSFSHILSGTIHTKSATLERVVKYYQLT